MIERALAAARPAHGAHRADERAVCGDAGAVCDDGIAADIDALDHWAHTVLTHYLCTVAGVTVGKPFTVDEVMRTAQIAPRHLRVVERWLHVLTQVGALAFRGRCFVPGTGNTYALTSRGAQLATLRSEASHAVRPGPICGPALWRFYQQAADELPALMSDRVQLQTLLFADSEITADIYGRNVVSQYVNAEAASVVSELDPTSVLEIGAGVGATSDGVLAQLSPDVSYRFTDVSPYFFAKAERQHGHRAGFSTGLLDINEPRTYGDRQWDVVVAANVLHNAPDCDELSVRLRQLLRPGGHLVMIETGREHHCLLVSMRLMMSPPANALDRQPRDQRRLDARILLTQREWAQALTSAGFQVRQTLPKTSSPLRSLRQFVLVAQAPHH